MRREPGRDRRVAEQGGRKRPKLDVYAGRGAGLRAPVGQSLIQGAALGAAGPKPADGHPQPSTDGVTAGGVRASVDKLAGMQ